MRRSKGKLLAIEGIDGSGKSSLVEALVAALKDAGVTVANVSEPSKGRFGKLALEVSHLDDMSAALLFTLDRMETRTGLDRLLAANDVVVQDRSFYSTLAYQGATLPGKLKKPLRELEEALAARPDLVILLDGPVELAMQRLSLRKRKVEPLEEATLQAKVRREYLGLARDEKELFVRLSFTDAPEVLLGKTLSVIRQRWGIPASVVSRRKALEPALRKHRAG